MGCGAAKQAVAPVTQKEDEDVQLKPVVTIQCQILLENFKQPNSFFIIPWNSQKLGPLWKCFTK